MEIQLLKEIYNFINNSLQYNYKQHAIPVFYLRYQGGSSWLQ